MHELHNLLTGYKTITLSEVKQKVRMMNRFDTKYVTSKRTLMYLLTLAAGDYLVQEIDGRRVMPYATSYFDTTDNEMYRKHQHGKLPRKKVRIRKYLSSDIQFLEVKIKNNKGRTDKQRIAVTDQLGDDEKNSFLRSHSGYSTSDLTPCIDNSFNRITLVSKQMNERITIDTNLRFHNHTSEIDYDLDGLAIIELKRDGRAKSVMAQLLKHLRVFPTGFSKYCMGMALTSDSVQVNRFKQRVRFVKKLLAKEPEKTELNNSEMPDTI